MIRIEKDKLIIEIESESPAFYLFTLQQAMVSLLINQAEDMIRPEDNNPALSLIREFFPSYEQLKELYNAQS